MSHYLQDLLLCGEPPLEFTKAMAVVSATLHELWAQELRGSEVSKISCVLSSITVRDFLFQAGFKDARVEPVFTYMAAYRHGEMIHNLGIGKPDESPSQEGHWAGHMIAVIPSIEYIVDTTLYQAMRPQWPDLPPMLATPTTQIDADYGGFRALAGLQMPKEDEGYMFEALWLHTPDNVKWRKAPDIEGMRLKRKRIVAKMVSTLKSGSFSG